MTNRTTIKLALALVALTLFGASIRWENNALRWAAIACVAVAFLLRFWREKPLE